MDKSRREFLKGTAWMGVAAMAAGCMTDKTAAGLTGVEGKPDVSGVVLAGNQLHGGAILLHVDKSWLTRQNGHVNGQPSG